MSTQSKFDMEEIRPQKSFEVVWIPDNPETEEKKKEEVELSDYGNIVSDYTGGMSKDYVKGKKGYMN